MLTHYIPPADAVLCSVLFCFIISYRLVALLRRICQSVQFPVSNLFYYRPLKDINTKKASNMPGRLSGKVAIITGAASGFGKGIAAKFVQEGAKVLIADLSAEAGQKAAEELGCGFAVADVTSREQWEGLLEKAVEDFGGLDIVVNNAGATYPNKPTGTVTDKDFDLVMNVNVKSIYLSSNVIVPYFIDNNRPGVFIQVSSTAAIRPRPGLTWYNASKAAVSIASKTMAVEYGPKKIRFNSVCPVVGSTGM